MTTQAIDIAARNLGMNERDQRAALSDYMATGGQNLDPATTAWCAAYVNASLKQAGVDGTGKLNARSFLDWGYGVDEPQRGDVAVFSRGDPNGWQGHVGFFDGYNDDGTIRVLGGNQSDAVSIANYGTDRLLGFRRAADGATNALASPAPQQAGAPQYQPQYPAQQAPGNALSEATMQQQAMAQQQQAQAAQQQALAQMQARTRTQPQDPRAFMTQPQNALAFVGFGPGQSPYT